MPFFLFEREDERGFLGLHLSDVGPMFGCRETWQELLK